MKNFLSGFFLMLFYSLVIIIFVLFVYSVANRIDGINVGNYLFIGISIMFCIEFFMIGINQRKELKKLDYEKKKKYILHQVNTLYVLITIAAIALILCVIYKSHQGMLTSVLFMAAFSLWELGACLGYQSLIKKNS